MVAGSNPAGPTNKDLLPFIGIQIPLCNHGFLSLFGGAVIAVRYSPAELMKALIGSVQRQYATTPVSVSAMICPALLTLATKPSPDTAICTVVVLPPVGSGQ